LAHNEIDGVEEEKDRPYRTDPFGTPKINTDGKELVVGRRTFCTRTFRYDDCEPAKCNAV